MSRFPLVLPSTASQGSYDGLAWARRLGTLIGPTIESPDDSRNAADLHTWGVALRRGHDTNTAALSEAFVSTATYLLDEWEAIYRVPVPSTDTDTRRAALLARTRAGFVGHPGVIEVAIADIAGASADVTEYLWSEVTANPKWVFNIVVRVDASVYGTSPENTPELAQVDDVVQRMKPAHVRATYTGTQTTAFLCDDANSLTDDTVLGA